MIGSHSILADSSNIFALSWNIRGIRSNLDNLKLLILKYNPTIITLQETYQAHIPNTYPFNLYNWTHSPTSTIMHHSVCIGVHNSIPTTPCAISSPLPAIAVHIKAPIETTLVSVYLPPFLFNNNQIEDQFLDLLSQLSFPLMIFGDFNAYHTNWGNPKSNSRGYVLRDLFDSLDLHTINNSIPTRFCPSRGTGSVLDHCVVPSSMISSVKLKVESDAYGSDHYPLLIYHNANVPPPRSRPRWKYSEADWDKFQSEFLILSSYVDSPGAEELCQIIREAASVSIPRTKGTPGKRFAPWWNKTVASAIKDRRKALRCLRKASRIEGNPLVPSLAEKYRVANRLAKKAIFLAKQESFKQFITEINPSLSNKEMWRRVGALSGLKRKTNTHIILHQNSQYFSHSKDVAEIFANQFFETSSTANYPTNFRSHKLSSELSPLQFPSCEEESYNQPFSFSELSWALNKCRGSSAGPDDVGYPLLQHLPYIGKSFLLDIINEIWQTGKIPTDWKSSLIVPILKPDKNCQNPESYRPISLLNCISKVMERMVTRRLTHELEHRKLLTSDQHAFRSGKGTETYFATFEQFLTERRAQNFFVDCAIVDLSKAFDRTWRRGILNQFARWGFGGKLMAFIEDFLTERTFQVLVGADRSDPRPLENGVPQGAILSPTLFLVGIESLILSIPEHTRVFLYADDVILATSASTSNLTRRNLQASMDKVQQWCRWTGFEVAPEKCKILRIRPTHTTARPRLIPIKYNKCSIPNVTSAKILGIIVDSNLSFFKHCTYIRNSSKSRLNLFRMLGCGKNRADRSTSLQIMNSWLMPKLLYGIEFVSIERERFEKYIAPLYHTAIRYCSGVFVTSPIQSILSESGQLPFSYHITNKIVAAAIRQIERSIKAEPLVKRANDALVALTSHPIPQIAKRSRNSSRPWNRPTPKIDWSIKDRIKAGCNSSIAIQQHHWLIQQKYRNFTHIYTDGSVLQDNAGCGIYSTKDTCSIKLPQHTSIFSAEAIALCIATEEATTIHKPNIIFTDSASVLSAFEAGNLVDPHLQELDDLRLDKRVTYCWIPGHAGIKGNEKADQLANDARLNNEIVSGPISKTDAIRWVNKLITGQWQKSWYDTNTRFLRTIKASTRIWRDLANPKDQQVLSRLRIGHTNITHSYICDKSTPPLCQYCGVTITIQHLLADCHGFSNERTKWEIGHDIANILSNSPANQTKLLHFLHSTNLYNKI